MAEPTRAPDAPTIPATFAWCSWHDDFATSCRLVRIVEQGSAAGGGAFACAPCRDTHRLTPVADLP